MTNMTISCSADASLYKQLAQFYEKIGWQYHASHSPEKWYEVISYTRYIAFARQDDELVAFGRILTDGVICMLLDVATHPEFRWKGTGLASLKR